MDNFWGNSTGERAEVVEDIKPIPAKTICKVMFEEVVNKDGKEEYNTNDHVSGTLVVIDGEYKNRKVFTKLHINDDKEEKKLVHRDALMRLYLLTKTPIPAAAPTDAELMQLCMKPFKVRVEVWKTNDKEGNWVSAYYPADYVGEQPKAGVAFGSSDIVPF